jgi:uncharacterized protein (TIGR03435 family)
MLTLRFIPIVLAACLVICVGCFALPMQVDQNASPAFEVVSIREVDSAMVQVAPGDWRGPLRKSCEYMPARVQCQLSLSGLISEAYQLKRTELAGPEWLDRKVFAFQATTPPDTTQEDARLMLQRALQERFGLTVHREIRQVPIYALVLGKERARLQEAGDVEHRKRQVLDTMSGPISVAKFWQPGHYFSMATTLDSFALDLNMETDLELPVMNMTGLTGEYRIDLKWPPNFEEARNGHDPGMVTAIQRLGLRLEKRKAAYNVLVVDHIEPTPTEN